MLSPTDCASFQIPSLLSLIINAYNAIGLLYDGMKTKSSCLV